MNIYTVRDNLKKTIKGKEAYLAGINEDLALIAKDHTSIASEGELMALRAVGEFLKININELKVILFDVEKCCEQHALMSWEINPERMGQ